MMNVWQMMCIFSLVLSRCSCVSQNDSIYSLREEKLRLKLHILSKSVIREKLPPVDQNNTVQLRIAFYCYQVLMRAEVEQSFSSYNYFEMNWVDSDLTWDPDHYGSLISLSLPYDDLWHPDVMVTNFADQDFMMIEPNNKYLIVHHSGLVVFATPAFLKTSCSLDLTFYPFDTQECEISLLPYFLDVNTEIVEVSEKEIPHPFYLQGEWTILSREMIQSRYGDETSHLPIVKAKMRLGRSHLFYVVTIVGPLVLTLIMTSFVFCIPPDSGERVSYLVTMFVSNAVFLNFIAATIPKSFTLSNMPRFVFFLSGVILESFFAVVANLYVLWKYKIEQQDFKQHHVASTYQQMETKVHPDSNHLESITSELMKQSQEISNKHQQATNGTIGKVRKFLGMVLRKNTSVANAAQYNVKINPTGSLNKEKRKRHITSREWDIIFFIVYHVISIPCYLLFFIYK